MKQDKYGFVYLWFDKAYRRFYIGCHWGHEDDGYICSSSWMKKSYKRRPNDFKRRILVTNIKTRKETFDEEYRFLKRIKPEELKTKYYNFNNKPKTHWSATPDARSVAKKSGDTRRGRSLPATPGRAAAISKAKKGKPLTEAHKKALSEAKKGTKLSAEHKQRISESLKKQDPAAIERRAAANRGQRRVINYCPECGKDTNSRRAIYCKDHRYSTIIKTRSLNNGRITESKAA